MYGIKEDIVKGIDFNRLTEFAKSLSEIGESIEISDEDMRFITKEIVLKAMRISNDEINFNIMCSLPLDKETIRKVFKLKNFEYLKHIDELVKYEMVVNNNETKKIEITDFGKMCVQLTNYIIEVTVTNLKLALENVNKTPQEKTQKQVPHS